MKKLILILLFSVILFNFTDNVFASVRSGDPFSGMKKGFGFLVKTRDESVLKPETIQERRKVENMIIKTYNSNNINLRNMLLQAFEEEVEGFRSLNNKIKENTGKDDLPCLDCLRELNRIKLLMLSSN